MTDRRWSDWPRPARRTSYVPTHPPGARGASRPMVPLARRLGVRERPAQRRPPSPAYGLTIPVVSGTGSGSTRLSAFDAALRSADAGDFNLVRLSSIIPAGSRVVPTQDGLPGTFGDVLYCVRAEAFTDTPGAQVWAGLGWVTTDSGAGLFVEHTGETRSALERTIAATLTEMVAARDGSYGPIQKQLASARCDDQPVCALVLAAYSTASWESDG